MSTPKKPRSDSPLRSLPEDAQTQVIAWLQEKSQGEVRKLVKAAHGFEPSDAALSGFWSWWHVRRQLHRNQATVGTLLEDLKREQPELSDEDLFSVGQRFFTALAIEQQDSLSWKRAQDATSRRELVSVMRRKLALLERKAQQADATEQITKDADLTPEEKQQRIRQIFGMA